MFFKDKTILITGGAGTLGQELTRQLLEHNPRRLIIFSRDDQKHFIMEKKFNNDYRLRFFIGDIRDYERLKLALVGVDYVFHTAALKHIDRAEYNSIEYKRTIVDGAENVIRACIEEKVTKCVFLSTDKASNSLGVYGSAKLLSDKLAIAANKYSKTKFAVIRYGNVIGSNGSIIQKMQSDNSNIIEITDRQMTRFWISLPYAAKLTCFLMENMNGGEILIPKIPSSNVLTFFKAMKPNAKIVDIPIRPAEKIHESMILEEDARYGIEYYNYYIIYPSLPKHLTFAGEVGKQIKKGFSYTSENNIEFLTDVSKLIDSSYEYELRPSY
jgi:UDP-N-acetylglucosamine 4,6-dehydratase